MLDAMMAAAKGQDRRAKREQQTQTVQ